MKNVCVVTGGGSGIGLATAKVMGKDHTIVIVGRTAKKLQAARQELEAEGIEAEALPCDVADYAAVEQLAAHANEIGRVDAVIHAAGMSPHMGEPETIMAANALGAINVNTAFYPVMAEGACLIDVASMAGHVIPGIVLPTRQYRYSRIGQDVFMQKMMARVNLFPKHLRQQIAYGISKNFVLWYAKTDAVKFGQRGARVLSVSPGFFETPMGELEKDDSADYLQNSALKRPGKVEEIANLLAFCASDKASYLTGVDILCDGGCVASGINLLKKGKQPEESPKLTLQPA